MHVYTQFEYSVDTVPQFGKFRVEKYSCVKILVLIIFAVYKHLTRIQLLTTCIENI